MYYPQYISVSSPIPTYKLHPKDQQTVDDVPLGNFIADVPILMCSLIGNIKGVFLV